MGKQKILDQVQEAINKIPNGTSLTGCASLIIKKIEEEHIIISRERFKALNDKSMEWG